MSNELAIETEQLQQISWLPTLNLPERGRTSAVVVERAKAKILIVDDEPDIVLSVGKRLAFSGYEILSARDGAEATKVALQNRPDLIILDIGMPCGDGHAVASRIRSNVSTICTPIIFLTARTSVEDRTAAEEAGAFAFVTKPFKPEELLSLIEKALER